jgi:ribose transport system permease protein
MTQKAAAMPRTLNRGSLADVARTVGKRFFSSQELGVFMVLLAMIAYLSYKTDTFTSPQNLQNVALSLSWIAIAAFGQTLVIITGGIDLSVGSVMALSGLASAYYMSAGVTTSTTRSPFAVERMIDGKLTMVVPNEYIIVAFAAGCGIGILIGLLNGMLIAYAKLPPFIATLGTMSIARGFCSGLTKGETLRNFNAQFLEIGRGEYLAFGYRFPYPSLIMLVFAVIMGLFLARTVWGYRTYAVGGNEQAADLSGINTRRVKIMVYTLSGLLGGLGGVLLAARTGAASPDTAKGYEMQVIASVVIGGTSLSGGKGTVLGTLIGAIILGTLRSGLNLLKLDAYWQDVAIGLTIIAAITFDQMRLRLAGGRLYTLLRFEEFPPNANLSLIGQRPQFIPIFMGLMVLSVLVAVAMLVMNALDVESSKVFFPVMLALILIIYTFYTVRDLWSMRRRGWVLATFPLAFNLLISVLTVGYGVVLFAMESLNLSSTNPPELVDMIIVAARGAIPALLLIYFWQIRWRFVA